VAKSVAIALFTRDLRVHDSPVLSAAAGADEIVPLFVIDSAIAGFAVPNRAHFLADSLADLDAGLCDLGAKLVVRHGRVVEQVRALAAELDATAVHIAADIRAYAQRRQETLGAALSADGRQLCVHDTVITVVAQARSPPPPAITSRYSPPISDAGVGAHPRPAAPAARPHHASAFHRSDRHALPAGRPRLLPRRQERLAPNRVRAAHRPRRAPRRGSGRGGQHRRPDRVHRGCRCSTRPTSPRSPTPTTPTNASSPAATPPWPPTAPTSVRRCWRPPKPS
jgi:deoxyribodipyrimidine photolyase